MPNPVPPALAAPPPLYWSDRWPEIRNHIATRSQILLALEFDGILAPTVPHPSSAVVPEDLRLILRKLAASGRITLALLSGRSKIDLYERLRLKEAYYIGNHGTELNGPGLSSSDGLASSCRSDLVDALAFLNRCTKRIPGILVEDKGMTVSVHWRRVDPAQVQALREWMELFVDSHPRLTIAAGEACWDLRARAAWDLADAVRQILLRRKMTIDDLIVVGREPSLFPAFTRLTGSLTISLSDLETRSGARYTMSHSDEVSKLLFCILCATNESASQMTM